MNEPEELTPPQQHYVRLLEEKGRELNRRWTTVQAYRGHLIRYMRWFARHRDRLEAGEREAVGSTAAVERQPRFFRRA